ncbi:ribonuclease P protein subunit p29-like isoform X2 [Lineus longissimus]
MSEHFVTAFLKQHVNPQRLRNELVDILDPHKAQKLENCGKHTLKKHMKPKKKEKLTTKDKKSARLFEIKPEHQKYELYEPMHQLWKDYMFDLIDFSHFDFRNPSIQQALLKADYHGCILTVTKSKCDSLVGISGIIIQETKNTFKIITKDDKLKVLPKRNSIFTFLLKDYVFNIHGDNFLSKTSMRARKTFKGGGKVMDIS